MSCSHGQAVPLQVLRTANGPKVAPLRKPVVDLPHRSRYLRGQLASTYKLRWAAVYGTISTPAANSSDALYAHRGARKSPAGAEGGPTESKAFSEAPWERLRSRSPALHHHHCECEEYARQAEEDPTLCRLNRPEVARWLVLDHEVKPLQRRTAPIDAFAEVGNRTAVGQTVCS